MMTMEEVTNYQQYLNRATAINGLQFEKLEGKYKSVQIVGASLTYLIIMAFALMLLLADNVWWCIAAETMLVMIFIFNITILQRALDYKGFALREHDISYRSGVLFPKLTTIPYDRIQQVSIKQNPVSKIFGLYSLEIVNGAQAFSSTTIPGLTEETAIQVKSVITEKMR